MHTKRFLMRFASILAVFVLLAQPAPAFFAFAEDEGAPEQQVEQTAPASDPAVETEDEAEAAPPDTAALEAQCSVLGGLWQEGDCYTPTEQEADCALAGKEWDGDSCEEPQNPPESAATSTATTSEPAVIVTGDATSTAVDVGGTNTSDIGVPTTTDATVEVENGLAASTTASSSAATGDNAVQDAGGSIVTGVADAFSWILSLFNVAIVNSTGAIHFYRNPVGDGLDFTQRFVDAFGSLADGVCSLTSCDGLDDVVLKVYDSNVATVENVAIARAGTGGNECDGGPCTIETGDANAMSGIVNVGNLTMVDSRYLLLFMANEGDLTGDILVPDAAFFEKLSTGAHIGAGSTVSASSSATIEDTASAAADSGQNLALAEGEAAIESGDARASASDVNFVNQLGAPICFVVAVGGEWHGGVYALPDGFSQEDAPFGKVICGAGGAERDPVTGLKLETVNYAHIFNTAIAEAITGHNDAQGLIARIKTGDARAFAQILNLVDVTLVGQDWIFADLAVSGDWNGDLVFGHKPDQPDILNQLNRYFSGSSSNWYFPNPKFRVVKEAAVAETSLPAKVDYTIAVTNEGGNSGDAYVVDQLLAPDGTLVGEQKWELGTVLEGEEVKITYTIEFKDDVAPGYYTNTATLYGKSSTGSELTPVAADDVVEILSSGEVLGTSTCAPILTQYIRPWRANDAGQVRALQSFLNAFEGESLAVTGSYTSDTINAVSRFQTKYAADVLTPWGISRPTGNVYYTTQKKVNEIACEAEFPLSSAQEAEIQAFKAAPKQAQDEIIKAGNTGLAPTNLLQFPFFNAPLFFKDASNGPRPSVEERPASTSALLKQELRKTPLWAMFAPFVDALEL